MKITLNNTITIDDQVELFHETYEGEVVEKGDWLYLIYQNSDKEKVVIKVKTDELVMTRFGSPQTLMRFVAGGFAPATIPTPMGVQRLVTNSRAFQLDEATQQVQISYDLMTSEEAELPLASYDLQISWKN